MGRHCHQGPEEKQYNIVNEWNAVIETRVGELNVEAEELKNVKKDGSKQ